MSAKNLTSPKYRHPLYFILFQNLCNCDASGDMNIDEGVLSNKAQLPVTSLNYGGSGDRFSWILYKLNHLNCFGKSASAVYPSELNLEARIDTVEEKTTNLENNVITEDYFFSYTANR